MRGERRREGSCERKNGTMRNFNDGRGSWVEINDGNGVLKHV